jgi:hypothetical protein
MGIHVESAQYHNVGWRSPIGNRRVRADRQRPMSAANSSVSRRENVRRFGPFRRGRPSGASRRRTMRSTKSKRHPKASRRRANCRDWRSAVTVRGGRTGICKEAAVAQPVGPPLRRRLPTARCAGCFCGNGSSRAASRSRVRAGRDPARDGPANARGKPGTLRRRSTDGRRPPARPAATGRRAGTARARQGECAQNISW